MHAARDECLVCVFAQPAKANLYKDGACVLASRTVCSASWAGELSREMDRSLLGYACLRLEESGLIDTSEADTVETLITHTV